MPSKRTPLRVARQVMVDFRFEDHTYQIDPKLKKVYRRFVEIETARAAEIFSIWRARDVSV